MAKRGRSRKSSRFFTLDQFRLANKIILLRVDYNVPLKENGDIADYTRIRKTLPTIKNLLGKRVKQIIIISHLGRPEGKDPKLSLRKVARRLQTLLKQPVKFQKATLKDKILVLENLRFSKKEEKNDRKFAKNLAKLADIYVNDAFSNSHRKHASMCAITDFLPSCAGLQLENELKIAQDVLEKPKRPFVAIVGGVKLNTKIPLMKTFAKKADTILIGSAIAQELEKKKKQISRKIVSPLDFVISDSAYMDIGPYAIKEYVSIIKSAKTICWNGPLGAFEKKKFEKGTKTVAKAIAAATKERHALSIAGGGETIEAIQKYKLTKRFTHISTGGGASLLLWQGAELPAVKALEKNYQKFKKKF